MLNNVRFHPKTNLHYRKFPGRYIRCIPRSETHTKTNEKVPYNLPRFLKCDLHISWTTSLNVN